MLFERFVFILYLLFMYTLYLLGSIYASSLCFVPLIALNTTLFSVIIVTLFQLQKLVKQSPMQQADKWSTLAWSSVHIIISSLFLIDAFQLTNVLIVLAIAGIGLTVLILIVAICSCYVIIMNGREWAPHIHLTCICFWVLVQYMSTRLPMDGLKYVTSVPVIAMAFLRVYEHVEEGIDRRSFLEWALWCLCILFHVFLDSNFWAPETFYWCLLFVVCLMTLSSRHISKLGTLCLLPFAIIPFGAYACFRSFQGYSSVDIGSQIAKMYDDLTAAKPYEPFEIEHVEDDFDTPL